MNNNHTYVILLNIDKMKSDLYKTYDYFNITLDLNDKDVLYNTIYDYVEDNVIDIFLNQPTIFPSSYYIDDIIIGVNNSIKLIEKLIDVLNLQNNFVKNQVKMIDNISEMSILEIIKKYYNIDNKIPKEFDNILHIFNIMLGKPDINSVYYDTELCSYKITQNIIEKVKQFPEKYAVATVCMI